MANKINLTLKVNDDGSLDITAKKAKKAAAETEKLGNATNKAAAARNKYNKGEKGVAQAGMNSTKAFSKMRNEMGGGSSGLVGAYATLAANVFAATAAFGALQRAAEFEQLTASVEFFGNAAGRNLELVVDKLIEVTDGALSAEGAFRGTALAISSGFDTKQLERLTGVAKGASTALGRDLNDAFDRLVRGAAKLEPEILDELGIMVRLDDATEKYAAELGKAASSLTAFEKRQAFLNATIEAGEKQFGQLQNSVPVNPFNQLAASFSNLTKAGIGMLNNVLVPVANFFAGSQTALAGGVVLFASTISKQMLPALSQGAEALRDNAVANSENAISQLGMLDSVSKTDTRYNKLIRGLQDGTKSIKDVDEGFDSLKRSADNYDRSLGGLTDQEIANSASLTAKQRQLALVNAERLKLANAVNLHTLSLAQNTAATAVNQLGTLNLIGGFASIKEAISLYSTGLDDSGAKTEKGKTRFKGLRVAAFAAGIGVRGLASAVFGLLGPIGLLLSFGPALLDWFRNKFFPEDELDKKFEGINKALEKIMDAEKQYTESSLEGEEKRAAGLKAGIGVQGTVIKTIQQALKVEDQATKDKIGNLSDQIRANQANQIEIENNIKAEQKLAQETGRPNVAALQRLMDQKRAAEALAETLMTDLLTAQSAIGKVGPKAASTIQKAFEELQKAPELMKFMSPQIAQLKAFAKQGEEVDMKALTEFLEQMGVDAEKGTGFINNLGSSIQNLAMVQSQLASKAQSPYQGLLDAAKAVQNEFDGLNDVTKTVGDALKDAGLEQFKDDFDRVFGPGATEADIDNFVTKLGTAIDTLNEFPQKLEKGKQKLAALNQVAQLSPIAFTAANKALDDQFELREEAIKAEKTAIRAAHTRQGIISKEGQTLLDQQDLKRGALKLERMFEIPAIRNLERQEIELQNSQMMLDVRKQLGKALDTELNTRKKIAETDLKLANLRDPKKQSSALDAADQLNLQQQFKKEEEAANLRNYLLTMEQVQIETDLTKLKFKLIKEQLKAAGVTDQSLFDSIDGAIANVGRLGDQQRANAALQFVATKKNIELETAERKKAFTKFASGQGSSLSGVFNLGQSTVTTEDGGTQSGMEQFFDTAAPREKLDFLKGLTSEYVETLKTLGPDGEFIAALTQGTFAITESFVTLGEQLDGDTKGMAKFGAVAQAVGASIGAVNSMMQAGYQRNISKIDEQIAAEQKRDGKSKASVDKIKALEKKKEQTQRKAFEMNKKMLMAQTIANTAAGIAGVLAGIKDPLVTAPLAVAMAAVIGAMGAAQLAVISGQSFDGGGASSAGAGAPSSISAGSRRNTVDIAKSQGARGELAYFRGESGTGGPENFRGAFAGYRNRAEGGTTGFMVGEQGPELFMPDRPGSIIPNDDIAEGAPTNVTFNINAIDSVGVEEVISTQRGNIIGMIRSAANSYGQDFIESVDTTVFDDNTVRSQAGSVSRY